MEGKRAFILGISGIIGQNLALQLKKARLGGFGSRTIFGS